MRRKYQLGLSGWTAAVISLWLAIGCSRSGSGMRDEHPDPALSLTPSVFPASTNCELPTAKAEECPDPQYATMVLTYTIGRDTVFEPGSALFVVPAYRYAGVYRTERNYTRHYGWRTPQVSDPTMANYTTAEVLDNPFGEVIPTLDSRERNPKLFVRFKDRVGPGAKIRITYGDRTRGGAGYLVPPLPMDIDLVVEEDPDADGIFTPVNASMPVLRVIGTHLDRFVVTAPTTPGSRDFDIIVRPMQGQDAIRNSTFTVQNYTGTVRFESSDPDARLPREYTFDPADEGVKKFAVSLAGRGFQTIGVQDMETGVSGISNPIRIGEREGRRVFWGVLQQHTNIGGHALQTEEFAFEYARDVTGLDFLAITEHCDKIHFDLAYSARVADEFYRPGEFVTFSGYEWSNKHFGHRHVVFLDGNHETCYCSAGENNPTSVLAESLDDLFEDLAGRDALIIPHHTAWSYVPKMRIPDVGVILGEPRHPTQKLFEIYSQRGSSERPDNAPYPAGGDPRYQWKDESMFFQNAISKGYRFGVTSGTDDHFGKPGGQISPNHPDKQGFAYSRKGLTAVYAGNLTRESIWEALNARRTYGTTGARIYLDFRVNGHPMGEDITGPGPPEITVEVAGTATIDEISILRNGLETVKTVDPGSDRARVRFVDDGVMPGREYSYYVRVVQEDSHIAWSSPVWFTVAPTDPGAGPSP